MQIVERISSFWKYDKINFITWKSLFSHAINEDVDRFPGVTYRLLYISEKVLIFYVLAKAGAKIANHYHDCDEIIYIKKGLVSDGAKKFADGRRAKIVKGSAHRLDFIEDSELLIIFEK